MERSAALDAVFKPVEPPTTFEETVERLGTAIRLGLLAPGSRLPAERDLAEQLCISRSTLRQALTRSCRAGIWWRCAAARAGPSWPSRRRSRSAARQAEPLGDEARAVLDYRVAVETGATVLAAERADDGRLRAARRAGRRGWTTLRGFEDYRRADVRFHIGVAEAARSPRLVTAMTEVQGQMSELIARIAHPEEVLTRSNAQHRRLVAPAAQARHRPRPFA